MNNLQANTVELNTKLQIKEVSKNHVFVDSKGQGFKPASRYALYIDGKGYLSFTGVAPYTPQGGKKALKSILADGGMLNYDGISFVNPV